MSVILTDMDMPETCEDCDLESHCNLWMEARRLLEGGRVTTIRHPDCPLKEAQESQ